MHNNFLSELVGCFATPIAENPTVAMMEAAFRHHDLNWRYINCEVHPDYLHDAVAGARAMGWAGFNCSLPHKVTVIDHLDGLGESAEVMGAVNTVVRRGDRFIGENTDGKGFVKALEENTAINGKSVFLFGAGGAARAIAVEMALAGAARVTVINRTRERGQAVVDLINQRTPANAEFHAWNKTCIIPEDTDIVINATSIGLYPDIDGRLDFDVSSLRPNMIVADAITNPPRSHLIRDAESAGCTAIDGLGMLVNQGVIAVKYWTKIDVNAGVMRQALEEALASPA